MNDTIREALEKCAEALDRLVREVPMGAGQIQQASMASGAARRTLATVVEGGVPHVVASGDPINGFELMGPFPSWDAAHEHALRVREAWGECWPMILEKPE